MDEHTYQPVKTYSLKQQTPIIHFQSGEVGATLRASEVKPKLDKFIIAQLGGTNADEAEKAVREKHPDWFVSKQHPALNYKLRFVASGEPSISKDAEKYINSDKVNKGCGVKYKPQIHANYFGNMVDLKRINDVEEKKKLVKQNFKETVKHDKVVMEVVCFIASLSKTIDTLIVPFFLLHNFGTRQNKGFGSFKLVRRNEGSIEYNVEETIRQYFPNKFFVLSPTTSENPLDDVNELYRLMKSGINQGGVYFRAYIYKYFHLGKLDIGNEKACIKLKRLVPVVGKTINNKRHEHNDPAKGNIGKQFKYVRAMLGLGDTLSYIIKVDENTGKPNFNVGKTKITIEHDEKDEKKKILRFASPIIFKIIDDVVYVLPFEVEPKMFNKKFLFKNENSKKTEEIYTPDKFDVVEFLKSFASYLDKLVDSKELPSKAMRKTKNGNEIPIVRLRGKLREVTPNG